MPTIKLREALKLSQYQFAKWLGAGLRTVQHWEQGRNIQRSTKKGLWALLFIVESGLLAKFEKWLKEREGK